MRISYGMGITAVLGVAIDLAGAESTFAAHKAAPHKMAPKSAAVSPALIAKAKQIIEAKKCNGCHAPDLKGKPGFSPSLTSSGVLKEYNPKTFAVVMDTGKDPEGKMVKPPMPAYHMSAADSNTLYTYFKSLK